MAAENSRCGSIMNRNEETDETYGQEYPRREARAKKGTTQESFERLPRLADS